MNAAPEIIPVVLFAYARPEHVARALAALQGDRVPLLYAFADGAKGPADAAAVAEVRARLRGIDWCEVRLMERPQNLGLGRNILAGVTEVATRHEAFIVWEDDLVCAPGTYDWMCGALRHYAAEPRVMSVTGWTHPRVTPPAIAGGPYFDARAESWGWGGYARSWRGMTDESALAKMQAAAARGISPGTVGADLPGMARAEEARNLWAVRWLYHHLLHGGLCLRPPVSLIDHAGFDAAATNAPAAAGWAHARLPERAVLPDAWPEVREDPACRGLWRRAAPGAWARRWRRVKQLFKGSPD
jgi:hypothetical protein